MCQHSSVGNQWSDERHMNQGMNSRQPGLFEQIELELTPVPPFVKLVGPVGSVLAPISGLLFFLILLTNIFQGWSASKQPIDEQNQFTSINAIVCPPIHFLQAVPDQDHRPTPADEWKVTSTISQMIRTGVSDDQKIARRKLDLNSDGVIEDVRV